VFLYYFFSLSVDAEGGSKGVHFYMQFGASVRHLAFIFCRRYLNWQTFADAAHVSSTAYFLRRTATLMSATGTDSQKCVIGETV
jgi:hypothetical protein